MNYALIIPGNEQKFLHPNWISAQLLLKVNGTSIIESLLDTCLNCDASSLTCLIDESNYSLYDYLKKIKLKVPFNLVINSGGGILNYIAALRKYLEGNPFILIRANHFGFENDLRKMLAFLDKNSRNDSVIAVKEFANEKEPYYVTIDNKNRITLVSQENIFSKYITCGLYYFDTNIFPAMDFLLKKNIKQFENLLNYLIDSKYRLAAFKFSNIIDVDNLLNYLPLNELEI